MATTYRIIVCDGTTCINRGSRHLISRLREQLERHGLADRSTISLSGCLGMCDKGPILVVNPGYTIYGNVTEADIPEIVEEHLVHNRPVARLAIQEDHLYNRFFRVFGDAKFFGKQMRIALRNCGIIDPENIDNYLSLRGYEALAKVLTDMTPESVVAEVEASGLRGRGGAGFPTGMKWKFTAAQKATPKYVICNADEGDPGAFMDRSAIEGDPHTIVEGMAIGGYASEPARGSSTSARNTRWRSSGLRRPSKTRGPMGCSVKTSWARTSHLILKSGSAPGPSSAVRKLR